MNSLSRLRGRAGVGQWPQQKRLPPSGLPTATLTLTLSRKAGEGIKRQTVQTVLRRPSSTKQPERPSETPKP
ncbi:hypothetical protein ACG2K1_03860 [Neisseria sp. 23W00296]|uniref:hypothetical protein n=1 Tax=unclassified Neisseria TaxID=2623750 RepID=UPI00375688B8